MTATLAQPPADLTDADPLGVALLTGLSRPFASKQTPWLRRTIPAAIVSFGVIPAFRLVTRFRQFATLEQQQFLHLARWLRASSSSALSGGLEGRVSSAEHLAALGRAAEECRAHPGVIRLTKLLALLTVVGVAVLAFRQPHPIRALAHGTYLLPIDALRGVATRGTAAIFVAANAGLSAAFLLHLYHVHWHASARRRFIARLNEALHHAQLGAIEPTNLGPPDRAWMVAAACLLLIGGVWAIPMALAASAHRRAIWSVSWNDRRAMARRVHTLLQRRRPEATLAAPVFLRPLCENETCRGPLPHWATYCPRCGDLKDAA